MSQLRQFLVPRLVLSTVLCSVWMGISPLKAETLPPVPDGKPALIIKGEIAKPNVGDEIHIDLEWLKSLPTTSFKTNTPWAEGMQEFEGVRLSVLFDTLGLSPKSFLAHGLDGYKADVETDWNKYPVIIAYKHNGSEITVRRLGPLRIVYPFTDSPELLTDFNVTSAVWQLTQIELF